MTMTWLIPTVLALSVTAAGSQALTKDPATGLPLIPATDPHVPTVLTSAPNEPTKMPDGRVCKSAMQANFYSLYKIKVDATVAWYDAHLSGFKKVSGYGGGRSQTAFSNADGTLVVIVTGDAGAQGANVDAYSVAYERYQPGLSAKTIDSLTQGKLTCQ
jgi:hypothetical protein